MPTKSKSAVRREAQKQDKSILIELPNPQLQNAFGDPFMLRNLRFDETLLQALRDGDEEVGEDDPRLTPLLHADLALAIEHFIRSRDAKTGQNLVVTDQAGSDHVWDLGECLQATRKGKGDKIEMSKSDHRWLLQKAKELAFRAFPIDARMFIDHLDVQTKGVEEEIPKEPE